MERILFINPFGIGDILFTTPLIAALKKKYPQSRIGYWCNARVEGLLRGDPFLADIFPLSRGDLKRMWRVSGVDAVRRFFGLVKAIRRHRFEVVFDFSLDYRYSLLCALLGIRRRIGFDYRGRGKFLTDRMPLAGYQDKHMVEYYLDLLKLAGIPFEKPLLHLFVSEAARQKAQHLLSRAGVGFERKLIGISGGAGASWGKNAGMKHWPAVKFAQLADALHNRLGVQVVLLGDRTERPIAEVITKMTVSAPVDLVGKTQLSEFAAVLTHLDLLVTNDGGPLHMASALGLKTVSIFGPVSELVYGPYPASADHRVITSTLECRPCYQNFRMPLCGREQECIRSIGVNEVFEAIQEVFQ